MTMVRPRTLQIDETNALGKVRQFLKSKGRESKKTGDLYATALYHFSTFLSKSDYKQYNTETILGVAENKDIDVYFLLDEFVSYLKERVDTYNSNTKLSDGTIRLYVAGVRSYLEYHDIELSSKKFRNKVKLPKKHRRKKEALTSEFIRTILLACNNTRLKVFILCLASSGARSNEILSLRLKDIDFSVSPTKIHIIAENTKTKTARDIWISDEASRELKKFIESKENKNPDSLVFAIKDSAPIIIYRTLHNYFANLLKKVELDKRRDGQGIQRRQISFHSFRRYVYTKASNTGNTSFAEWLIGHIGSEYYEDHEDEARKLYIQTMKYLTFLDFPTVENIGRDFESKLAEKDKEIEKIKSEYSKYSKEIEKIQEKQKNLDRLFEEARANPTHRTKNLLVKLSRPSKDKD
jgi:integrase